MLGLVFGSASPRYLPLMHLAVIVSKIMYLSISLNCSFLLLNFFLHMLVHFVEISLF
jgi:hypothetical protein